MKLPISCIIYALLFITLPATAASDNIETSLLKHISEAQKNLSATEQRIAGQRNKLAKQLNSLEREVLALREKTAVARRLADEKTLSLSQLEKRLEGWRQQQAYQHNLLNRFLQQHGSENTGETHSVADQLAAINNVSLKLEQRFFPQWSNSNIVLDSGKITKAPTLAVGPVTWFWDKTNNSVGLASKRETTPNALHIEAYLSGGDSNAVNALRTAPIGEIVFDPTLNRALAQQQHAESVIEHIVKGGLWAIPIVLFGLFALAIALHKVAQLWRLPAYVSFTPQTLANVLRNAQSPLAQKVQGMQRILLDIGANTKSARERDDLLFMQLQQDKTTLEKRIGAIAITAAVAPLLGLLGTVSGMIETFKMMTLFGAGDPEVVSGGIAQALVTTELGLVVAIPALILNAVLSRKAKTYYNELESFAILISKCDEQTELDNTDKQSGNAKKLPASRNSATTTLNEEVTA
ncbi:MotA/TolQ/ExbB proton channel family protein [Saccharophagus degradans]|uniref:MotA/TolQ/ExbB proton channel n=1 Tax=Saccharophagus degradans (strain 2-40 / ATCC 43961 / DSM 17024) TaxID=203122 RepID=Q21GV7_SACD2|nr:MotA/TolQ/ExbB proton channel family protein [Saccharophagus degradans]ABD82072.1 MotA/TolQ/ExbB proton channel [Saccharophagus degradans 2-40]